MKKTQKFNPKKLAAAILKKRTAENLDFRKIEAMTNGRVNRSTLYRVEACISSPSPDMLADICNWLGQDVQTFF